MKLYYTVLEQEVPCARARSRRMSSWFCPGVCTQKSDGRDALSRPFNGKVFQATQADGNYRRESISLPPSYEYVSIGGTV